MNDICGRWALVTGASRGVGRQVALGLADLGCNLILHSREKSHTEPVEKEVREKGVQTYSVACDLSKPDEIDRMLDMIEQLPCRVDILYNIAGVNCNVLDYFHIPLEYYEECMNVNFLAVIKITQHFIPKMLENGFGRIVHMISVAEFQPKALPYIVSKDALRKASIEMAYALNGTNIILSMETPGWVRTDMGTWNAPNPVESCLPGILLGAVVDDGISGRHFLAERYMGMTLEQAYQQEMNQSLAIRPAFYVENSSPLEKVSSLREFRLAYKEFISSDKKKLIFGGGNQARFFGDVFSYLDCEITAFLCTNKAGQNDINGKPLYSLDEFSFDKNDCVVVVAVTEQHIRGVEEMLREKGFIVEKSYSILYTENAWKKEDGDNVSYVYNYRTDTFSGKGIGV